VKRWLLLLCVLTACAPTVHVVEEPKKPTFADVDVCTVLQDSDVERQRLAKTTPLGARSCGFEFGANEGKVSIEVTLTQQSLEEAKRPFCEVGDGCLMGTEMTTFNGRSILYRCVDTSGSVRCEGFAHAGERQTVGFVVARSPETRDGLGEVTTGVAQTLLNRVPVTK
jgi:hypothetical protein